MAQRRRANGLGSEWFNAKRNRYEVRITVNGKRRTLTGKTQAEAWANVDALRATMKASGELPPNPTVAEYANVWVRDVLPGTDLARSTREQYDRMLTLYVLPYVGTVRLADLRDRHVRAMLAGLRDSEKSENTRRQARGVLSGMLEQAQRDELVDRNAARLVGRVRGRTEKQQRTMTPEQARALLSEAPGDVWGALVALLLESGVRKGEALGLSWAAVDLDADPPEIRIRQAIKKSGHALYLDEPKTPGSVRTIHVPGVAARLKAWKATQAGHRLALGPDWGGEWADADLVFTDEAGSPLHPDRVNIVIKRMTTRALGEPWTPHELRHTAASLMLAAGVDLKHVSERLGHSSIRVTADVYAHLLKDSQVDAANSLAGMLYTDA